MRVGATFTSMMRSDGLNTHTTRFEILSRYTRVQNVSPHARGRKKSRHGRVEQDGVALLVQAIVPRSHRYS